METFSVILGFLCGFFGGWLVFSLIPFALLSGYRKYSLPYLVTGVALLVIAYGLGIVPVLLLVLLLVILAAFVAFYLLTIPGIRLLPKGSRVSVV